MILYLFVQVDNNCQVNDSLNYLPELSDSGFVMQKSPTGAMLRSALIPGWGQFYNESYWKIPVFWGISGWFIYLWIDRNNLYNDYKDLYQQSLSESSSYSSTYKDYRDFYRDARDQYAIYLGLTYFLNIIDAYVDAHLFDFDVGINQYTQKPELNIRIKL